MTTRLPVLLENLRIATPCSADWSEMAGDDRVRFCGGCEKNVYNLSAMTRDEAEALVRDREGRLCVRLYQRADGTVLTQDCPVGVRRTRLQARVRGVLTRLAASAALLVGVMTGRPRADLALKDGTRTATHARPVAAMGGAVAMPPPDVKMGKIAQPPAPPKKPPAVK